MSSISIKFNKIYLPVLFIFLISTTLYGILYWLIIILNSWSFFNDEVLFFAPMVLTWLPLLIWVRRKLNLFRFKAAGSQHFGLLLVAWLVFSGADMLLQNYIAMATGKLTLLQTVSEISKKPITKYYKIKAALYDKQRVAYYNSWETSGKNDEFLNMRIYTATPAKDTARHTDNQCSAWIVHTFKKNVSNKLKEAEKNSKWHEFFETSWQQYDSIDFSKITYLMDVGQKKERKEYIKAIENDTAILSKNVPVLVGFTEPFEDRYTAVSNWFYGVLALGAGMLALISLLPKLDEDKLNNGEPGIITDIKENLNETLDVVKLHKGLVSTQVLIYINVIVYLAMVFSGLGFLSFSVDDLLKWGADYKPLIDKGEWWRLITNMFLHDGIMHLFMNMYGFIFVGMFIEPIIGSKKFAFAYLFTGICASLTSIYFNSLVVSVGASGAIFGMYGVFVALLLFKLFPDKSRNGFLIFALSFIGINIIYGFKGGIDMASHIGGIVSGFILGILLAFTVQKPKTEPAWENE